MNQMRQRRQTSLMFSGLISCALTAWTACNSDGQDGFVTVGVRPMERMTTTTDAVSGGAVGLPMRDSELTGDALDAERGVAVGGAPRVDPEASVNAGPEIQLAERDAGAPSADLPDAGSALPSADAGSALAANEDECGVIPDEPAGKVTSGRASGPGLIEYDVDAPNVFTRLRTTLAVPMEPTASGTIFIWSGIQPTPHGESFQPIGNGALLPVLTWGPSCAPDSPSGFSTWSIAPTYSNVSTSDPQYSGCHAGKAVRTEPGQRVDIEIVLEDAKWVMKVTNQTTLEASQLDMDLQGQAQGRAIFDIELPTGNRPTEDVIFTHTVLTMNASEPEACEPVMRGTNDFASRPRVSADGKHCCIDRIVLRASGVDATTQDPP